jgi:ribosome recycling factor
MDTDLLKKLQETREWLQREYSGIRTGQATPALLDNIKVDNYGNMSPINQVGSVGVEDARTLRISVWDNSQIPGIEQSIREAELGVSVSSDSAGLRVSFPELTSERREQLLKLAKSKLEDARITVRSARDESMKLIEKAEKDGDIGKDDMFSKKEEIQSEVGKVNKDLELMFDGKEVELSK